MSYDHVHDGISCEQCGVIVILTMDWDADDPECYECYCTKIRSGEEYPDHWSGHEKPLSAF